MKVNIKYILSLVNIEPSNWGLIMLIVCINWIRLDKNSSSCKRRMNSFLESVLAFRLAQAVPLTIWSALTLTISRPSPTSVILSSSESKLLLTILGCIMFFMVICLAMAARYYHLAIYGMHGVGANHARYLFNRNNEYIAKQAHASQAEKATPSKNRHPIAEEFNVRACWDIKLLSSSNIIRICLNE